MRIRSWGAALVFAVAAAACSDTNAPNGRAGGEASPASSVALTGNVITVEMHGIGGQYFEPAAITAQRGDVIRFVLVSGVHNASFPADRNPAGVRLPAATPYLQAPGQTYDVTVDLPVGEYEFVCDPHIALGMIGNLKVE